MRKSLIAIALAGSLTACISADQIKPAVSGFNGDSVQVQIDNGAMSLVAPEEHAAIYARADKQAADICRRGHRKRAEFTSTRIIPTGPYTSVEERLYLCLN